MFNYCMNDQLVVEINAHMVECGLICRVFSPRRCACASFMSFALPEKSVGEPLAGAQAGHANSRSI